MKSSAEQLLEDLQRVVADLETLMQQSGNEQTLGTLQQAQARIKEVARRIRGVASDTRDRVEAADDYVRQNPWRSLGVVAAVAFVVGMLTGRRG